MREAEVTLHYAVPDYRDPRTYGPGFSGPGEFILWHRQDGRVLYHLGNQGDRLPNHSFFDCKQKMNQMNQDFGAFLNFEFGPRVEKDYSKGKIIRFDVSGENTGLWAQVAQMNGRWDFRGLEKLHNWKPLTEGDING